MGLSTASAAQSLCFFPCCDST
uniref:Uncharacterized protein n=1 Tax=Anguilla anguilla TaxID=7936 RepID=A0A0E9RK05_ANGAN